MDLDTEETCETHNLYIEPPPPPSPWKSQEYLLKCLFFSLADINKENFYWNNQNTKLLLHLFQERKEKFRDPKIKRKFL